MTLTQNSSSTVQQHQHAANNSVQQQLNIPSGIMQNHHGAYSNDPMQWTLQLQNAVTAAIGLWLSQDGVQHGCLCTLQAVGMEEGGTMLGVEATVPGQQVAQAVVLPASNVARKATGHVTVPAQVQTGVPHTSPLRLDCAVSCQLVLQSVCPARLLS